MEQTFALERQDCATGSSSLDPLTKIQEDPSNGGGRRSRLCLLLHEVLTPPEAARATVNQVETRGDYTSKSTAFATARSADSTTSSTSEGTPQPQRELRITRPQSSFQPHLPIVNPSEVSGLSPCSKSGSKLGSRCKCRCRSMEHIVSQMFLSEYNAVCKPSATPATLATSSAA